MESDLPPVFRVLAPDIQQLIGTALRFSVPNSNVSAQDALTLCDKALEATKAGTGLPWARAVAGICLLRGQIFERDQKSPRLPDALASYDRGIALLQREDRDGAANREWAVLWMNRGNVLQRTAGEGDAAKAAESYDQTIRSLKALAPTDGHTLSTLGGAFLNKGSALQRLNTPEAHTEALGMYEQALQIFTAPPAGFEEHFARLVVASKLNRGTALLAAFGPQRAQEVIAAANEVVGAVEAFSEKDAGAGDMAMRGRRLACEAAGVLLQAAPDPAAPELADWVSVGTDNAEAALALAQHWDRQGMLGFRPAVPWFLHFGAALYAQRQPQFLGEFLVETLDSATTPPAWKGAAQLKQIALEMIERLRAHLRSQAFQELGGETAEQANALIAELQDAEKRLALPPQTATA